MRDKLYAGSMPLPSWLSSLAKDAGLPATTNLLDSGSLNEMWSELSTACGVSEEALACYLAAHLNLPLANLALIDSTAAKLIPEKIARQFCIFPVRANERQIVLATADAEFPDHQQGWPFSCHE